MDGLPSARIGPLALQSGKAWQVESEIHGRDPCFFGTLGVCRESVCCEGPTGVITLQRFGHLAVLQCAVDIAVNFVPEYMLVWRIIAMWSPGFKKQPNRSALILIVLDASDV